MASGFDDFSSYTVDDLLQAVGWTTYNGSTLNPIVTDNSPIAGGKSARWTSPQVQHQSIVPDAFPSQSVGGAETLVLVRRQGTEMQVGGALRADGNGFATGALRNNTTDVRLARVESGSWAEVAVGAHGLTDSTAWTWVRVQRINIDGTATSRLRVWAYGDAEPSGWTLTSTGLFNIGDGRSGLYVWQPASPSQWMEWAWLAWSDGTEPAPMPAAGTTYTLTTNVVGSGSITLDPPGGTYDENTVVSATAVPAAGWTFTGWSGALSGTTNPQNVTMDAAKTITATFTEDPPDAPTGLAAVTAPAIGLSWDAVVGADSYDLERDGTVIETGLVGTSYTDTAVVFDTQYSYRLRSDTGGVKSDWTAAVSHTPTTTAAVQTEFVWDGTGWV